MLIFMWCKNLMFVVHKTTQAQSKTVTKITHTSIVCPELNQITCFSHIQLDMYSKFDILYSTKTA